MFRRACASSNLKKTVKTTDFEGCFGGDEPGPYRRSMRRPLGGRFERLGCWWDDFEAENTAI